MLFKNQNLILSIHSFHRHALKQVWKVTQDLACLLLALIKTMEEFGQGLPWSPAKIGCAGGMFPPVQICTVLILL